MVGCDDEATLLQATEHHAHATIISRLLIDDDHTLVSIESQQFPRTMDGVLVEFVTLMRLMNESKP
jgi:hypothetical protein